MEARGSGWQGAMGPVAWGTVPPCSVPPKMSEVEGQRSWNNGLETSGEGNKRSKEIGGRGGEGAMVCLG